MGWSAGPLVFMDNMLPTYLLHTKQAPMMSVTASAHNFVYVPKHLME